jgi:uncharacterized phosphatase
MKQIFLVRHGETDWNSEGRFQGREDVPLNVNGEAQAMKLADAFCGIGIERVVTSHLSRARETAAMITRRLMIPEPMIVEGLHERHYGEAAGLLPEERMARFPKGVIPPGQESVESLHERAVATYHYIAETFPEKKIIIVSHGGVINSLINYFSNGTFGRGKTRLINCSISRVCYTAKGWKLDYVNIGSEELDAHEKIETL